jgi:hypothetical protein
MLDLFNGTAYLLLSIICAWAIMSHRFRDGVFMKVGLILVSTGFFCAFLICAQGASSEEAHAVVDAIVHSGLLVCICAYLHRQRATHNRAKRLSDWVSDWSKIRSTK